MKKTFFFVMLALAFFLVGCPRLAYLKVYNNADVPMQVVNEIESVRILPGDAHRFQLGYKFTISSELGIWTYDRNVPYGGDDGPFFDGTLTIQIEPDGTAYALPVEQSAPNESFPKQQPEGYPQFPSAASNRY